MELGLEPRLWVAGPGPHTLYEGQRWVMGTTAALGFPRAGGSPVGVSGCPSCQQVRSHALWLWSLGLGPADSGNSHHRSQEHSKLNLLSGPE